MAGVDVGQSGGHKRATNSDINMIPFIDLLMVTIAFLLITAVWVTNSRINADAQVPNNQPCDANGCDPKVERTLHVTVGESDFTLAWRQGGTVISEIHVPKSPVEVGDRGAKAVTYPDLAKAVAKEWEQQKVHFDASDRHLDQVVLHSDNRTPFKELVAVLDAVSSVKRDVKAADGKIAKTSAFKTTFAVR
jgi:biopolymer transport protein ExbD